MLTVPEAARRLGKNPETVRRWIRDGRLRARKVGTQHVIEELDLDFVAGGPAVGGAGVAGMADPWLPAIVGRIVRRADPLRIILFGSRARGDSRPDSDYDLLVVVEDVPNRRAMRTAIHGVLADLPIAKDVVVAPIAELSGASGRPRGVLRWALDEGRVIYERA